MLGASIYLLISIQPWLDRTVGGTEIAFNLSTQRPRGIVETTFGGVFILAIY